MEYENHIPAGYREAFDKLIFLIRITPDLEMKKKFYDSFSQKYTMLSYLWEKRIQLELPPEPETITREIFEKCLKLKKKAMKQFYYHRYLLCFPGRLQEPCKPEKMEKLIRIYHLPYVEVLSKICDIKRKEAFRILACKKMEQFLTFPHSQLSRFYRHYQRNSGTPLPNDIKEKYDKAVKSYQKMITVAMEPYEWIKWMKDAFASSDWIQNFECKLGEHFFMKEIWFEYIQFLDEQNNVDVLDVYKRYCRLFITDTEMRLKYSDAITKYQKQGCNVLSWLLDQVQFEVDFISPPELGLAQLKRFLKDKCSGFICRECFEAKNQEYFNGQLNYKHAKVGFLRKKKEIFECFICDENSKNEFMKNCGEMDDADVGKEIVFRKSLAVLRSTAIKFHPTVTIQFHDSLDPSLPRSIFQYILQNANHQLLSKIYATAKYFFVKQQILLCYRIQISSTSIITFMEQALFTNAKTLLQLPVKKYCCGTTLTFSSDDKGLLSKCLPKLCFCSLTNLIIDGQNLCLDEFMTLLSGGKMEQLSLKEVRIFKEKNEKIMKIEEIFQVLPPTVTDLSINTKSHQMFSPQTAKKIVQWEGKKFESFRLYHIPDFFNLGWFEAFLKIHMQPRGNLRLKLRENVNDQFRNAYKQFCINIDFHWYPSYQGPQFD